MKTQLPIFIISLLLTFLISQANAYSKIDFVMDELKNSYKMHFDSVHHRFNQAASSLSKYIESKALKDYQKLTAEAHPQQRTIKPEAPKRVKNENLWIQHSDKSFRYLSEQTNRGLQEEEEESGEQLIIQTCQNGAATIEANKTTFWCEFETEEGETQEQQVSYGYYQSVQNNSESEINCRNETNYTDVCYCPYDYYGEYCQSFIELSCDMEQLNYLNDCEGENSKEFWYEYGGPAPCYFVEDGDSVTLRAIVDCRPESLEYYYEGIKDTFSLYENLSSTPEFTYEVAGPNLNLTTMVSNIYLHLDVSDFRILTRVLRYTETLNGAQITGQVESTITLRIDDQLKQFSIIGRIFTQLKIYGDYFIRFNPFAEKERLDETQNTAVFDLADYREPAKDTPPNLTPLWIVLAIIGVVIIGLLYYKFVYKVRKAEEQMMKEIMEKNDDMNEQLY